MRLVHYSTTPGLKETDPSKIGTSGVRNQNMRQGKPKIGATYFYKEGTEPEDIVRSTAKHKYVTSVHDDKIVDLSNDPKDTYNKALDAAGGSFWHHQDFHQAVLDAGYHGYYNSDSALPNAVAMLKPQPVKYIDKDPKGHKNTSFGDEHFTEFEKDWPKAGDKPAVTSEHVQVVNSIVDRLLSEDANIKPANEALYTIHILHTHGEERLTPPLVKKDAKVKIMNLLANDPEGRYDVRKHN